MPRNSEKRSGGSSVDKEVAKLMSKKNGVTQADFTRLQGKIGNQELVDKIQTKFNEAHSRISRKAKKFAQLIRKKYSHTNYPFHTLLEKAKKFKQKYNLSEAEFAEFKRITERELAGKPSSGVLIPQTNMGKVLGSISLEQDFNMNVSDSDYRHLGEILQLYKSTRGVHSQVMLQSMQYTDCDYESLTGKFSREHGDNPTEHVHPVVAALFFPKIDTLEHHFLYSNIAGIVSARKNRKGLKTRPDYELFDALTRDPNDVVCDNRSPMADLLSRANLQSQLWNSVLKLRAGQYYGTSFREFISSVDVCRLNRHDNPDLVYGRNDGTVLKRLVSAFSFNPTVVATTPVVNGMFSTNPYMQSVKPVVRHVPMINLRLQTDLNDNSPVDLSDSLTQSQLFLENGRITPLNTSLIYSRGVMFFYVDRRASVMRVSGHQVFNLSRLPLSVGGFERLNNRQVNFDPEIRIRGDVYHLRSVVVQETNRNDPNENLVVGSSTVCMIHADPAVGRIRNECFHYDPLGVTESSFDSAGNRVPTDPITAIPYGTGVGATGLSFVEMASRRGTVFMYELVTDATQGLVNY